jgi:hypothetical protein
MDESYSACPNGRAQSECKSVIVLLSTFQKPTLESLVRLGNLPQYRTYLDEGVVVPSAVRERSTWGYMSCGRSPTFGIIRQNKLETMDLL